MSLNDGHLRYSSGLSDAVPFSENLNHIHLVRKALGRADEVGEPFASLLQLPDPLWPPELTPEPPPPLRCIGWKVVPRG
jgi:hypothetical protein